MELDEINLLLKKLQMEKTAENEEPGEIFTKLIDDLHKEEKKDALCTKLVEAGVIKVAMKSLQNGSTLEQTKAAELVAELAKVEECRPLCVDNGIVPLLVDKMLCEDTLTALQVCRALGNICYEYDKGRCSVMKAGGALQLIQLLKRAKDLTYSSENRQLQLVSTGFLLNLLNSYENIEVYGIDDKLVDIMYIYLEKFSQDEEIPTHVLLSLSCLADLEEKRNLILSEQIVPHLVKILKENKSAEVIETCLELLTNLAETENMKTQFASGGVCEAVTDLVKYFMENTDGELTSHIIKTASDLMVLILVGDSSMVILYGDGEGSTYKELVRWLTSTNEDLQIAGALTMGNFARNDSHCIQMMEKGIAKILLEVLSNNKTIEGDIRLQHALLSALRNLCIAKQNKLLIIQQGALDVLLPMVCVIETFPVVFKLLATLRMIIDGCSEAAIKVSKYENVLKRIVGWCNAGEHVGVQGEASRILAWIIKNCNGDPSVIEYFIHSQAILPLVVMLSSEHPLMVNEASLALALIFSKNVSTPVTTILKDSSFVKFSTLLFKNSSPLAPEIIGNLLSAYIALSASDGFREFLQNEEMLEAVRSYHSSCTNEEVKNVAQKMLNIFDSEK